MSPREEFPRWDHGLVYIGAIAALILIALYLRYQ